jgi:hypothetical protein
MRPDRTSELLYVSLPQYFLYITAKQYMVGSLKMNTALEYSTRVVQEGDRRCKKSTLNDLAYLTPLRIPLMNPVIVRKYNRDYVSAHKYAPIKWAV